LSSGERRADELMDKLILSIKSLVLLQASDELLKEQLETKLKDSKDESLQRFVRALSAEGEARTSLVMIALGELVLASFLILAGTVVLLPTLAGINTASELVTYFSESFNGVVANTALSPYLPFVEFILGLVLMLSAFYALRHAATSLKEAGFAVEPGET
jgi:hypothetical protein